MGSIWGQGMHITFTFCIELWMKPFGVDVSSNLTNLHTNLYNCNFVGVLLSLHVSKTFVLSFLTALGGVIRIAMMRSAAVWVYPG